MKLKPVKHYQKPRYAAALASLLAVTGSMTGCTEPPGVTEVQLDGDIAIEEDTCPTASTEAKASDETVKTETELQFEGDIVIEEDTCPATSIEPADEYVGLAGDVAFAEDIETLPADSAED